MRLKEMNMSIDLICEEVGIMADKKEISIRARNKIQELLEEHRENYLKDKLNAKENE